MESRYKCIICRKRVSGGRKVSGGESRRAGEPEGQRVGVPDSSLARSPSRLPVVSSPPYVLCPSCNRKWLWYPNDRYFRLREPDPKWQHQNDLLRSVTSVVRPLGVESRSIFTEVGFPDWGISRKGGLLRWDIAIPKIHLLLDYHGVQHYTADNPWHRTREAHELQLENDELKRKVAPTNGWHYVIFSYREKVEDEEWVRMRLRKVLPGI